MKRAAHARYKRVGGAVPPPPPLPPTDAPIEAPAAVSPAQAASRDDPAPWEPDFSPAEPAPASVAAEIPAEPEPERIRVPEDWVLGQLLNVRGGGNGYRVTLLGEEYDPRRPERCLEFSNSFECQHFVSNWYARKSWDPRA